jgi:hypothetical protein
MNDELHRAIPFPHPAGRGGARLARKGAPLLPQSRHIVGRLMIPVLYAARPLNWRVLLPWSGSWTRGCACTGMQVWPLVYGLKQTAFT